MPDPALGPIRFVLEHRNAGGDCGPTLHVRRASDDRELLRFDCFERSPHWHVDPPGRDEITSLHPGDDSIAFAIGQLESDPEGLLKRAGLELDEPLDRGWLREKLGALEPEMRNPPVDLDALEVDRLRTRQGEKWAMYPPDVLSAWVADMDFPAPAPVRRALLQSIERSDIGYPLDPDRLGLREAFVDRMHHRFGWTVHPDQCVVITDVVQAVYVALEVYSEPGDGAVIQTPIYPPFLVALRETDRRLVASPWVQGRSGFEIDLDQLSRAIDARTRIFLLCNPHNPTGRVLTREELEAIAEVVLAHNLVVVTDEIHQDLVFSGHRHIPFASLGPEIEARTVTVTSATKAFSIAGLRCGIAAFGSEDLQRQFDAIPRHVRGGINILGAQATLAAWQHAQPWLDRVLAHLERNRDHVARFVADRWPSVRHFSPEGTYLAWLDFRATGLDNPGRFFLSKGRVALSQGHLFGEEGAGFVRLNFATSKSILDQILRRMDESLATRSD
jgi:cystathionine beta-lyase